MMKEGNCTNYLGIDWGERKIGIALAHGETKIALAYGVVPNDAQVFEYLRRLVQNEQIKRIVIGIPSRPGSTSEEVIKKFGDRLAQVTQVQVILVNEMFTTKMAHAELIALGTKRVGQVDDAEAAKVLLQGWVDKETGL